MATRINLLEGKPGKYGKEDSHEDGTFYKLWDIGKKYFVIPAGILSLGAGIALADDLGNPKAKAFKEFTQGNQTVGQAYSGKSQNSPVMVTQNNNHNLKIYVGNFEQNNMKYPWGKSIETRDIADTVKTEVERGLQEYFMLVSRPELADVVITGSCVVGTRTGERIVEVQLNFEFNDNGEVVPSKTSNWFYVDLIDPSARIVKPEDYEMGRTQWSRVSKKYADELNSFFSDNNGKNK